MPEAISPPAATTVAPVPSAVYNPAQHVSPNALPRSNPKLAEALARHSSPLPATSTTPEPQRLPSQPPRAPLDATPPADEKPAAHVKFITPDERETVAPTTTVPTAPAAPSEPAPDVLKSASAQIREAYERLKSDLATRATEGELTRKELAAFKAKAQSYEDRIKTLESADARAKELEKQVLTKDELIRVTNYTQSEEYHNTYERPVAEATQAAYSLVKDLLVTDDDGNVRAGTASDFQAVLAQPNHTLAKQKAKELFGQDFASEVFQASLKVRESLAKRSKALEEAGTRSLEYAKQQQERAASSRTQAREAFDRVAAEMDSKYPGLYTPPSEDAEALAARTKGEESARMVIVTGKPEDMPGERFLSEAAKVYQRAASWPVHQLQISRLQAELESTKARLSAFEKSSPDTSSRQQPGGVTMDAGGAIIPRNADLKARMRESLERRSRGGK